MPKRASRSSCATAPTRQTRRVSARVRERRRKEAMMKRDDAPQAHCGPGVSRAGLLVPPFAEVVSPAQVPDMETRLRHKLRKRNDGALIPRNAAAVKGSAAARGADDTRLFKTSHSVKNCHPERGRSPRRDLFSAIFRSDGAAATAGPSTRCTGVRDGSRTHRRRLKMLKVAQGALAAGSANPEHRRPCQRMPLLRLRSLA
jgi:hypothetical protein